MTNHDSEPAKKATGEIVPVEELCDLLVAAKKSNGPPTTPPPRVLDRYVSDTAIDEATEAERDEEDDDC